MALSAKMVPGPLNRREAICAIRELALFAFLDRSGGRPVSRSSASYEKLLIEHLQKWKYFFKDMDDAQTQVGRSDNALFEYLAACEMNYANYFMPSGHVRGKREDIGSFLVAEGHVVSGLPKPFRADKISLPKSRRALQLIQGLG